MRLIFRNPPLGGEPKDAIRINPDEVRIGRTPNTNPLLFKKFSIFGKLPAFKKTVF